MKIPPTFLATRATPITPYDKSTAITISTWVLLGVLVVMFLARAAIKSIVSRKFSVDDLLILLATILAIGLSVTTLILASEGLGILEALTLRRANAIMKAYYASDFLYISSLCFVKLSLVACFYKSYMKNTNPAQRRIVLGLGIFIVGWTLASLVAVAFQCGLPRPWEMMTLHCYNSGIFWIVYCIIDMTTDVSIIMLSVNLVAYLKVSLSRKVAVVACFAPRILVIGAALVRLVYLYPITPHDNPEFNLWIPVICTQVQVCLSISTACIPYMKPFFGGADPSTSKANELKRRGMSDGRSTATSRYWTGHKTAKEEDSLGSTAMTSLKWGRTPDISPRIPSPLFPSPLTTPRLAPSTLSSRCPSRNPSERGLRLQIPGPETQLRRAADVPSPQTASSHALSPECISPQQLLSPPTVSPSRRTPTPPPPSHSPRPRRPDAADAPFDSPDSSSRSRRPPSFSLFPQQRTARYALIPQQHYPMQHLPSISLIVPQPPQSSSRNRNRISVHRMPSNTSLPRDAATTHPPRTSSRIPSGDTAPPTPPKPNSSSNRSTAIPASYMRTPPPTRYFPASASSSSSPPPSIPNSYLTTPSTTTPPRFPVPEPPSPQRLRNLRVLTPQNSSRREQVSPVSPASPRTTLTFWREETTSSADASAGWKDGRPWDGGPMPMPMPAVRDVRSSPLIVVRRPS
ncbi:hypothetical protein BDV95DRAFT_71621 [Massariosphaeria phaeospora]|uniref:Rhodopsin domain-containing protein n=1 Tax=Massariosphaeria phaeospora TaxID=100035 RepID=A0A7C8MCQ9_9PLEO|nr:hypothetical protein BDV95DRAFT_71621 [Massariosphaeria phaeospora]